MVIRKIFWALVVVAILGTVVTARTSRAEPAADACLSKPNGAPPQGSHWYYRHDRTTNRRCWYLGPQRAQVSEAGSARQRPLPKPTARRMAEPPATTIASADGTMPAAAVPWLGAPASNAANDPEPAPPTGADEPSEPPARSETLPAWPVLAHAEPAAVGPAAVEPAAVEPAAGEAPLLGSEDMRALTAIALVLAVILARRVVQLFAVRRLRRRRQDLRAQWEGGISASSPRSPIKPELVPPVARTYQADEADEVDSPSLAPSPLDFPRRPAARSAARHDFDDHAIEDPDIEQSLQRLLADWRRAAA